ncbi:MAG: amidohydrolase family protein [Kiritimatiellae bacterium]|nr:amidohydrolase family protein [Kiritimatiellia bacterium]
MNIDGYCVLGVEREFDLTAETLLAALDAAKVDCAVIAPADSFLAVNNRAGNDFILETAGKHRRRFIPTCSVNPWYGKTARQELKRAIDAGARLLVLHPFVQGFSANDELVNPLLKISSEEKMPVYIHTGHPGNATPWQLVDLAEQFPEIDFIMGHCGATDFWNDVIPAVQTASNIYLESSLARPFAFASYLAQIGKSRGIMGSYAPLNDLTFEWEQTRMVLPPEKWDAVYGGNLLRLIEKRGKLWS